MSLEMSLEVPRKNPLYISFITNMNFRCPSKCPSNVPLKKDLTKAIKCAMIIGNEKTKPKTVGVKVNPTEVSMIYFCIFLPLA